MLFPFLLLLLATTYAHARQYQAQFQLALYIDAEDHFSLFCQGMLAALNVTVDCRNHSESGLTNYIPEDTIGLLGIQFNSTAFDPYGINKTALQNVLQANGFFTLPQSSISGITDMADYTTVVYAWTSTELAITLIATAILAYLR